MSEVNMKGALVRINGIWQLVFDDPEVDAIYQAQQAGRISAHARSYRMVQAMLEGKMQVLRNRVWEYLKPIKAGEAINRTLMHFRELAVNAPALPSWPLYERFKAEFDRDHPGIDPITYERALIEIRRMTGT